MWPFKRKTWTKWSRPRNTDTSLTHVQTRYCEETGEYEMRHIRSTVKGSFVNAMVINSQIDEVMNKETE